MARIYTGMGDDGYTYCARLGSRVPKDHPLIEAVGCLDELNSFIGFARSLMPRNHRYDGVLARIQRELFILGYAFSGRGSPPDPSWLEKLIDREMQGVELRGFIIPYGSPGASALHAARTICRRLERRLVAAARLGLLGDASGIIRYVNRLGDALYAMAVRMSRDDGLLEFAPSHH